MTRLIVYACAALLGAALMGFEMVASRLLTPYFGSGIITWAALISAVLLAIMIGYLIGGALVDRFPTFGLAAAFAGLAGVWLVLVPSFAGDLLTSIMDSFESEVVGVLISAALLLLVPITALGTFSPVALRLLLRGVGSSGRTAGLVYGISTLGNIVGTLGTLLVLVPRYGTGTITYLIGGLVLVCAAILAALAVVAPTGQGREAR